MKIVKICKWISLAVVLGLGVFTKAIVGPMEAKVILFGLFCTALTVWAFLEFKIDKDSWK